MKKAKKNVPPRGSNPNLLPPQKVTIKRPTSSASPLQSSTKKQKQQDNKFLSKSESESMSSISEATLTDQILSQPDLDSPSLSVFKPTSGSLPTTIRSSSPEKPNSSHSLSDSLTSTSDDLETKSSPSSTPATAAPPRQRVPPIIMKSTDYRQISPKTIRDR
ncbi:unnamed protein product [Macrosiphum euphorbiae]|uniref:Uncharacterized protein n=1 Tax=Macrosiphum euphorbiae TaxID=13131 RepID=A0AAV0VT31_9HEMI|nr:unnamed protein product [Macrosiphum euphorbiae]